MRKKRVKNLSELIFSEDFTVDYVFSEFDSEVITILDVTPDNDIPIETLVFKGYSPVIAGNSITAKVARYDLEKAGPTKWHTSIYFARNKWNKEESAIEIIIWDEEGDAMRTDEAKDYKKFMVEKPKRVNPYYSDET